MDQRPEAGVDVAKLRCDHHRRLHGVPSFPRSAPDRVNHERDVVRRPAEEEDGRRAADDREGPLLAELRGAAVQSQRSTRAADDQNGRGQQEAQRVVQQARHQLAHTGRRRIILRTQRFVLAALRSRHKNPLGGN